MWKDDFELRGGGEGQDTSRHFGWFCMKGMNLQPHALLFIILDLPKKIDLRASVGKNKEQLT